MSLKSSLEMGAAQFLILLANCSSLVRDQATRWQLGLDSYIQTLLKSFG